MKIEKVIVDFKIGKARFKVRDRSTNSRVFGKSKILFTIIFDNAAF